jgi:hypothetical protein
MERLTPDALNGALTAAGVSPEDAAAAATHLDDTMKRAILALYRSAISVGEEWGPISLESRRPVPGRSWRG